MTRKNERTIDVYTKAGAYARLFELIGHKMINAMAPVISTRDVDKLLDMMWKFSHIKSAADSKLFSDFPRLGHEWTHVFYGDLNQPSRDRVDETIIELVKEIVNHLVDEEEADRAAVEEEWDRIMKTSGESV